MKKILILCALLLSGLLGFVLSLYLHDKPNQDDVQLIQTFHYPALFVKQLENDPDAGKKIFNEFCSSCHGKQAVIDVNAPRIDDHASWQIRKKLGMPILLKITLTGVGAMPARGGCFECSDEQLREAIQYILSNVIPAQAGIHTEK